MSGYLLPSQPEPSAIAYYPDMCDTCRPYHDPVTASLTAFLCIGLIISYIPQHYRIISSKTSEGFSPWFLFLGGTSAAAGLLNMFTVQWGVVKCCRVLSATSCLEMTGGIIQVGLQWFMFSIIQVLHVIYYPPHLKYVTAAQSDDAEVLEDNHDSRASPKVVKVKAEDWKLTVILGWATTAFFFIIAFATFFLLVTTTPQPKTPSPVDYILLPARFVMSQLQTTSVQIEGWAVFLGVTAASLAAVQYAPQLYHTYHSKVVGALSIPMMCLQTPGGVIMVLSIALRPGTNWTSWIMFAVAAFMQGMLLTMCIVWKFRQRRLHIDDFGNPLDGVPVISNSPVIPHEDRPVVADLVEDAVEEDIVGGSNDESTPLLVKSSERKQGTSWLPGFLRRN